MLITEPVLWWRHCPAEVMVTQLDRLLAAQTRQNVRLGIVPVNADRPAIVEHSFHVFDDLVLVETGAGTHYHQADDEAAALLGRLDVYWASIVEGDEARALILAAIERHRAR